MNLRSTQGFTLIELLIVVVIIGILAAIAIPRFASTKGKAFDAAAKTDLRNAMTAQEAYFSDNQEYADFTVAAGGSVADPSFQASTGVTVAAAGTAGGYAMTSGHQSSDGTTFCVDSDIGQIDPC